MSRQGRWTGSVVVAAAVAAIAFSVYLLVTWPPQPPPEASGRTDTEPSRAAEPLRTVAVLGDSFSTVDEPGSGPAWPTLMAQAMDWTVHTEAVDGGGYVTSGNGGPFSRRTNAVVKRDPDLIIVAGGVSDVGAYSTDRIADAADAVVTELRKESQADLVLLSPFSFGPPGPLTKELSARFLAIARREGVMYVDATTWLPVGRNLVTADLNHLTEQGHRRMQQRMEEALTRLGLAEETPAGP